MLAAWGVHGVRTGWRIAYARWRARRLIDASNLSPALSSAAPDN
jgi:hypothetical protein